MMHGLNLFGYLKKIVVLLIHFSFLHSCIIGVIFLQVRLPYQEEYETDHRRHKIRNGTSRVLQEIRPEVKHQGFQYHGKCEEFYKNIHQVHEMGWIPLETKITDIPEQNEQVTRIETQLSMHKVTSQVVDPIKYKTIAEEANA